MESGAAVVWQRVVAGTKKMLRTLRTQKMNREILVFAMFLLIAIAFWFSQTFKDHTTVTIEYELQMVNVPQKLIFTSDKPSKVNVTVAGRGIAILQYLLNRKAKVVKVDYDDLSKFGGVVTIDNYVWKKCMAQELPNGVAFVSASPSNIEIYYSMGNHKLIPVEFAGVIRTSEQYRLCGLEIEPQEVDIYAPSPQFDTLKVAYSEPVSFRDVEDTIQFRVALRGVKGVKMVPDSITVKACVDLFTTKTVKVPIYCENIPQNKILRTFPLMAEVSFKVSATMFDAIQPEDFIVVVDYNSIKDNDRKCRLLIRETPEGIFNAKVNPNSVDYIIEQED